MTQFESHFGVCPRCKKRGELLNVERSHFFACHKHRCYWYVGFNLFLSWKKETWASWEKNDKLLRTYKPVEPFHPALGKTFRLKKSQVGIDPNFDIPF